VIYILLVILYSFVGTSPSKVKKVRTILDHADEEIKEKVKAVE